MEDKVVLIGKRRGPTGHPIEFKLKMVELLNQRGTTAVSLSEEYGVTVATLYRWRRDLELGGETSFYTRTHFDVETKTKAVKEYLAGKSAYDVCEKYGIPREQTLHAWSRIMRKELSLEKFYPKNRRIHEKTTKEDRLKLVQSYISSQYSYIHMDNPNKVSGNFVKLLFELYEDYGEHGLSDDVFIHKNYPSDKLVIWKDGRMRLWAYQRAYGFWKRHAPMCNEWKNIGGFIRELEKIEGYDDGWFVNKCKLVLRNGCSVWSSENCRFVPVIKKEPRRFNWVFVHENGTRIPAKTLKGFAKDMGLNYANLNNQATTHRGLSCDGWRGFRCEVFDKIKHVLPTRYYLEAEKLFAVLCRENRVVGSDFLNFIINLPMVDGYNEENLMTGKTRVLLKDGESIWSLENCYLSPPIYKKLVPYGGDKMIMMFLVEHK